jgi:hypothetical protein
MCFCVKTLSRVVITISNVGNSFHIAMIVKKNSDPRYVDYQSNIEVKLSYKMSFFHYLRYNFSPPYLCGKMVIQYFLSFLGTPYHISKEVKSCIFRWWWIITYTLNPKPLTPPNALLFHGFFNLIFSIQIVNQVLFFTYFWNFTVRAFFFTYEAYIIL